MISFEENEEKIKQYFQDHLTLYTGQLGLTDQITYIEDAVDLDKYVKNTQLFFDFSKYNFTTLSNESNSEEIEFNVYMTFKGEKPSVLNGKMKKYAAAIYEMFEMSGENFEGIIDIASCDSIAFFPMVCANAQIKCFEMTFTLKNETN